MANTFICDISSAILTQDIIDTLPKVRQDYVNSINDTQRKKQSVFAWKLLQFAMRDNNVAFFVDNGKWCCENKGIFFSMAHSSNIVVVSINDDNVGVDVELCSNKILKIAKRITSNENLSIDELTKIWTEKESLFKCGKEFCFYTDFIFDRFGNKYCVTTCSSNKVELHSVEINDLL